MNKTRFLVFAVAAMLLLNLATVAFFVLGRPPGPRQEGPKKIIAERLHFDAEQVQAYDKLIARHQQEIREKQREMGAAKTALYSQLQGQDFSKKDSLIAHIGTLQQQIETIHFQHFSEIKNLCNGEQIQAFNDLTTDLAGYFAPRKPRK
ncbi:MAG: periplasmic heavy metal sensor [Lewinellaceae bacterium]|nr:periplasmic heavy metal sensor [Saprospiraceae bacterium]MCB9334165.1 periplasmic heavy metal sensor [Lewinellaceae bacterium]